MRRAQEQARSYLKRSEDTAEKLRQRRAAGDLTDEQAIAEFNKLRAPLNDILEQRLKPCLADILTRAQRELPEPDLLSPGRPRPAIKPPPSPPLP